MKVKVKILLLCFFYITNNLKAQDLNIKKDSLDTKTFYLDEITLIESQIPIKRKESGRSIIKIDSIDLKKFGGRNKFQVIFDTYVNPKINSLELEDIIKIFRRNNVSLFSTFNYDKFIN